jgi:uncharacterized protein (DUF342 family)
MEKCEKYNLTADWLAEIKISEDNLSCSLRLQNTKQCPDTPPDGPEPEPLPREKDEEETINPEMILELLDRLGIVYGLDETAIENAFRQRNGEWVVAASGIAPQQGEHARLEVLFAHNRPEYSADDTIQSIDYRDRGEVLFVEKDTLLARKTPALPGVAGKDVKGRKISPAPVRDILLKCGKNTYSSRDGLQVYAADPGNPVVNQSEKQCIISIEPVFVVNSDVDLNTGHIRFRGDILINGKVNEAMEIVSDRNIKVLESVTGALIRAEGSVHINNNVINSHILAGSCQAFYHNVYPLIADFEQALANILKSFQQIKSAPGQETVRFGYVLNLLVEKKFTGFVKQVETLLQALSTITGLDFRQEIKDTVTTYKNQLQSFLRLPYQEINNAVKLLQTTSQVKGFFNPDHNLKSDIKVMYCLNSKLEASGSVTVAGQGCFHTDIIAYDSINIKGVVRGGSIKAQNSISLNKVGSEAGIVTKITVPVDRHITINELFENTTVTIGKYTCKFEKRHSRVKIRYNSTSGEIEAINF